MNSCQDVDFPCGNFFLWEVFHHLSRENLIDFRAYLRYTFLDLGSNPSDSLGTFLLANLLAANLLAANVPVELPFCLQDVDTNALKHAVLRFLEE